MHRDEDAPSPSIPMPTGLLLRFTRAASLAVTWLLGACGVLTLPPAIDAATVPAPRTFHFADGGSALYYTLDKSLTLQDMHAEPQAESWPAAWSAVPPVPQPATRIDTFVFFISGSGCTSLQYFLPRYFDGLEGESGPIRIFMLQKRFIGARTWGRTLGCSVDFTLADHPSQWLADQAAFITAQLNAARAQHRAPGRVVIAGVSEGAEIVPLLAQRIPRTTHVVLIGNGGMPPMQAYRLQLARHGLQVPAALAALPALAISSAGPVVSTPAFDPDPSDANIIAGHTRRYWAELAGLDPAGALAKLPIPVWVAMGENDDAVPIASAKYLAQEFARQGRANLVLKIYPGAGHALDTNSQANTANFWFEFDRSMAESVSLRCRPGCLQSPARSLPTVNAGSSPARTRR
jgi:pimeloyl-ACP methyl ester carboxylesterase